MVQIYRSGIQFIAIWTFLSLPSALAQRSTFSNLSGITLPSNTTTTGPAVSNPNDISNGTSSSSIPGPNAPAPVCTALQHTCEYTLGSSGGLYTAHTCCDSGSTCIPYGANAGLCIPSAFSPSSCPKSRTCVPTSTPDGNSNALLLGPQCCSADQFCSELGCVSEIDTCDASTVCIPQIEPWGQEVPFPIAAQCCKAGGRCAATGCQYPDGGASNSTGTGTGSATGTTGSAGSGSCAGSFICEAAKICVPTHLSDGTASSSVLPAQCCGSEQFCGATGCQSGPVDDRGNFRRMRRGRRGMA